MRRAIVRLLLVIASSLTLQVGSAALFEAPEIMELDGIKVTGDLAVRVPIAKLELSRGLFVDAFFEHRLEINENGHSRSAWSVPALETGVYPTQKHRYRWNAPGGRTMHFIAGPDGLARNGTWILNVEDVDVITIRNDMWIFTYRSGQLTKIAGRRGLMFDVDSAAGRIRSIRVGRDTLVSAGYRLDRQLDRIVLGDQTFEATYINGQLDTVEKSDGGRLLKAGYNHNLLSSLRLKDSQAKAIAWDVVRNFGRGDCRAVLPRSLQRYGDIEYTYELRDEIVMITTRHSSSVRRLYYNMVTRETVTPE